MKHWKSKNSEEIDYGLFTLQKELIETSQEGLHYLSFHLPTDAVMMLAKDSSGQWILNKEYRHSIKSDLIGCPGGRLEKGENPIDGAIRELLEETGYLVTKATLLGSSYPFPGICSQKIYFVYGEDATYQKKQNLDPLESIETILLSEKKLKEKIDLGEKVDGILLTALWFYHQRC